MNTLFKRGALTLFGAASLMAKMAVAQTLTIGLAEDPDVLDPDRGRSYVGRVVFTGLCDKLVDVDAKLNFVPQLAIQWSWNDDQTVLTMTLRQGVKFHDGTPFNAEAVKYNLDRSLTLPDSNRKNEISAIDHVEAVDDHTVKLHLKAPFAPLIAALSDRAGMMISPAAAKKEGADFSRNPVCSGPFEFVNRVAQDKITLKKFPDYWNKEAIHVDEVIYRPIPDATVRLANLQSGQLDIIDRAATADLEQIRGDDGLKLESAVSLGYNGITINLGHGPQADNPLGQDPRVREAFELAIDRNIINQVAFDGEFTPGNQPLSPDSPYHLDSPLPVRDVERSKALLKEAGVDQVDVELLVANNPDAMRVAQIIQSMAGQVGFNIEIIASEFASMLDRYSSGDFQAGLLSWSGRADPDGNLYAFLACDGTLNDGAYCNAEVDEHFMAARRTNDVTARQKEYAAAENILLNKERPIIYLYHPNWFWGLSSHVKKFKPYPDGMIRLEDVSLD
jgi:peptide/nickel transport system substrate-binding protein